MATTINEKIETQFCDWYDSKDGEKAAEILADLFDELSAEDQQRVIAEVGAEDYPENSLSADLEQKALDRVFEEYESIPQSGHSLYFVSVG